MAIALYAEFTVKSGSEDRVAEMVAALTKDVRQEAGNIAFDPYVRSGSPNSYFVYEIYRDEEAFQEHINAEHSKAFNAELSRHIVEDGSKLSWLDPLE